MVNFKIMVVEDEGVIALDLQRKLEEWGYTVEPVVSSGEKAVRESFRIRPDLIIMDIGVKGKFKWDWGCPEDQEFKDPSDLYNWPG